MDSKAYGGVCCLDLRFGIIIIAVIEIFKGLACLGFGIQWDTTIIALACIQLILSVLAGMSLVHGAIKSRTESVLVYLVLSAIEIFIVVAMASGSFRVDNVSHYGDYGAGEIKTIAFTSRAFQYFLLRMAMTDICFWMVEFGYLICLKKKEKEDSCTKILF